MKDTTAGAILVSAVLALGVYSCLTDRASASQGRVGPASAYPPSFITGEADPKVTQANIHQTVCVAGYTQTVRAVSEATKHAVLRRDHATQPSEVDHYLSLEIGGSNDPDRNLWAEPYAGRYGARVKDVVETRLKREICASKMTLKQAQACITSDWISCGRKIGAIK